MVLTSSMGTAQSRVIGKSWISSWPAANLGGHSGIWPSTAMLGQMNSMLRTHTVSGPTRRISRVTMPVGETRYSAAPGVASSSTFLPLRLMNWQPEWSAWRYASCCGSTKLSTICSQLQGLWLGPPCSSPGSKLWPGIDSRSKSGPSGTLSGGPR